ncbi:hypothetical protein GCM10022393_43260 [Aquimarina addita]|uniref:Uncharacterized protein n=1 Tax=Aquimarina addita TaxID=870485 RepID=A0ABP6UW08_9FLAO
MSDTTFFKGFIFKKNKDNVLSNQAVRLKTSIDSFYETNNKILVDFFKGLKRFNEEKFNTNLIFEDYYGNKLTYFEFYFLNRNNIQIISRLNQLIYWVNQQRLGYLNAIIQYLTFYYNSDCITT